MVTLISRSEREFTFTFKYSHRGVDQFWSHLKIPIINQDTAKIVLLGQLPWQPSFFNQFGLVTSHSP